MFLGLRRRWRNGFATALGTIGSLWLVTEILTAASSNAKTTFDGHHSLYLAAVALAALATFLRYTYEPSSVSFTIPTTATTVTIKFGDLFTETGDLLVAVNEFFDHNLGQVVSTNSVHGAFIQSQFNSDESRFRLAIDTALSKFDGSETTRSIDPTKKYPIGTTATIPLGNRNAYLVALSETDLATAKSSASVPNLWIALTNAWQAAHDYGNGRPLAIPLVGNGRSSINLEPQHLLRLVILSLVDFARKKGLPTSVTVVVHDNCFEQLDIREIARDWKQK